MSTRIIGRLRARLAAYDKSVLLRYPLLWETRAHILVPGCVLGFGVLSALLFAGIPVREKFAPSCALIFSASLVASVLIWLIWLLRIFPNSSARENQHRLSGWSKILWWLCCTTIIFTLPSLTTWTLHQKIQATLSRDQVLVDSYTSSALQVVLAHLQESNRPIADEGSSDKEPRYFPDKSTPLNVEQAWRNFTLWADRLTEHDRTYLGQQFGSPNGLPTASFHWVDPVHPPCKERIAVLEAVAVSLLKIRVSWTCLSSQGPKLAEAQLEAVAAYERLRSKYLPWPNDPTLSLDFGSARERWRSILYSFNLGETDRLGGHSLPYPIAALLLIGLIGLQGFFSLRGHLIALAMSLTLSWTMNWLSAFLAAPLGSRSGWEAVVVALSSLLLSLLVSLTTLRSRTRSYWNTIILMVLFLNASASLFALPDRSISGAAFFFPDLLLVGLTSLGFVLISPLLQWLLNHYHSLPER